MRPLTGLLPKIRAMQDLPERARASGRTSRCAKSELVKEREKMPINDHISNMLTRMRNAQMAGDKTLEIPSSNMLVSIASILKEEGFIEHYKYLEDKKQGKIRIHLKHSPIYGYAIIGMNRLSKPGRRVYVGKDNIPTVKRGYGICILSTSKGVVTGDKAKKIGVGGELLCEIW